MYFSTYHDHYQDGPYSEHYDVEVWHKLHSTDINTETEYDDGYQLRQYVSSVEYYSVCGTSKVNARLYVNPPDSTEGLRCNKCFSR